MPTFSTARLEVQLVKWLQGSTDCQLPCFAGIIPKVTTQEEAKHILSQVGEVHWEQGIENCNKTICGSFEWDPGKFYRHNSMGLWGDFGSGVDGRIITIYMDGYPPSPILRLDQILDRYGIPAKVYIEKYPEMYAGPSIHITLAYPNDQFIIHYRWEGIWTKRNNIGIAEACIQQNLTALIIDARNQEWTDDFIRNQVYYSDPLPADYFIPLEKATGISIQEFYEKFRNIQGDECIQVPFDL